jgi:hypothetical protein
MNPVKRMMKTLGVLMILLNSSLLADYRDFAYTYQARTLPQGAVEFEYYIDSQLPDASDQSVYSWRQQFEIEYGITDRLSAAVYQSMRTTSFTLDDGTSRYRTLFDSVKVQAKYRLTDPGQYLVDALVYAEYVLSTNYDGRNDKFEIKEVLSKDLGKTHLALNLTEEIPIDGDFELAYDAAGGYDFCDWFLAGIQTKGQLIDTFSLSAGPAFTFRAKGIYLTTAILAGLNDNAADMDARALIGISL